MSRAATAVATTGSSPRSGRHRDRWRTVGQLAAPAALLVAAASAGAARGCGVPAATVAGPALVVGVLLGLPHGALDGSRLREAAAGSWRRLGALSAAYAGVAAAAVGAWYVRPAATLLVLLVLAGAHFVVADLEWHRWSGVRAGRLDVLAATVTGLAPVVLPFGVWPGATRGVLADLSGGHAGVVVRPAVVLTPVLVALAVVVVARAAVRRRPDAAIGPAAVAVLFVAVTPLVAFAVYFACWHAVRQSVPELARISRGQRPVRAGAAIGVMLRRAAVPSLLAVALAVVLCLVAGRALLATGLVWLLALSVPHAGLTMRVPAVEPAP